MYGANCYGQPYLGEGPAVVGTATVSGSASSPLGALTSSATGTRTDLGAASAPLGALTVSAAGLSGISGVAATPLGALIVTALGVRTEVGSAASPLGALSVSAAGVRTGFGTSASPLGALIVSALRGATGTASVLLGPLQVRAAAAVLHLVLQSASAGTSSAVTPNRYGPRALGRFQDAAGATTMSLLATVDGVVYAAFAAAAGRTDATLAPAGRKALVLQDVQGSTAVSAPQVRGRRVLILQPAAGVTQSLWGQLAELSDNPPIPLGIRLHGQFILIPPEPA